MSHPDPRMPDHLHASMTYEQAVGMGLVQTAATKGLQRARDLKEVATRGRGYDRAGISR